MYSMIEKDEFTYLRIDIRINLLNKLRNEMIDFFMYSTYIKTVTFSMLIRARLIDFT